jgi:hypothetical protein
VNHQENYEPKRVKVDIEIFNGAADNLRVHGAIIRASPIHVAVLLGKERPYRGYKKEGVRYKLFLDCEIFYAQSSEDLQEGFFVKGIPRYKCPVILWC